MKVTTEPTGSNGDSFVSERWSADSGSQAVNYLRKQLRAAAGVFPDIRDYSIFPNVAPKPQK